MIVSILIFGASGHASVVADAIRTAGEYEIAAFIEDGSPPRTFCGAPVLNGIDEAEDLRQNGASHMIVAIGNNAIRMKIASAAIAAGWRLATAIHPRSIVSPSSHIGAGTVIAAGAIVNPGAAIGENVIVNTAASVDHDCVIEEGVHIGPGCHLGGFVRLGGGCWLGIGSIVRDRICIGKGTIVGAGSVVVEDLPAGVVAYGVPAKVVRRVNDGN